MKVIDNFLYGNDGKKVEYKPSPNTGAIKKTTNVFVVHFDAASSTQGLNWMLDKQAKVSAHLWLSREGRVVQLVPFNVTAWHAGESSWRGVKGINSSSIGIELQNTGSQEYTDAQMSKLQEIINALREVYTLEIVGHEDIAPIRKQDPSGSKQNLFDWKRLFDGIGVRSVKMQTIADLNVRRGQGTEFPVVKTLSRGTSVYELKRIGEWSKIQVEGNLQSGWCNNKFLTK